MHIDTESKNYKRVRNALSWLEYAGGCAAVDSVVIPFIYTLYQKKLRWMRPIAMLGTLGISIAGGYLSRGILDDHFDAVVELINAKNAEKKQNREKEYVDWRKPNEKPEAEKDTDEKHDWNWIAKNTLTHEERVVGEVGQNHLFWFTDENEIRYVTEKLWNILQVDGYATLKDLIAIRNSLGSKYRDGDDYSRIEDPEMFGWRKEDVPSIEYTQTWQGRYVINLYSEWGYLREAVKIVGITDIQDKEDKEK